MKRTAIPRVTAAALAAVCIATLASHAGDLGCALCGCHDRTSKVCHRVCEMKKVTITCYGCKEEDFCVPGPSCPGDKHCETICESSIPCAERQFVWCEWIPSCKAKVLSRKKLQKRTVTREVPTYKWVTQDLCPQCAADCDTSER